MVRSNQALLSFFLETLMFLSVTLQTDLIPFVLPHFPSLDTIARIYIFSLLIPSANALLLLFHSSSLSYTPSAASRKTTLPWSPYSPVLQQSRLCVTRLNLVSLVFLHIALRYQSALPLNSSPEDA